MIPKNGESAPYRSHYIVLIVGPTAIGKTEAGISLAKRIGGEIISADSRQFYRHMDAGTAKPTLKQQKEVPHHLIDILDPDEPTSSGRFRDLALYTCEEILSRNKVPVIVGGSGLYIKALLHGIFDASTTDEKIRNRLKQEIRSKGLIALYNRLVQVDPDYAIKIHMNDAKRITRALEIYEMTGVPISKQFNRQRYTFPYDSYLFGLEMDREQLYDRINRRVDDMIHEGLIQEVRDLIARGYKTALKRLNTLGYKEAIQYLNGDVTHDEMVENLKRNTRRYAKRQITWFRNQEQVRWIHAGEPLSISAIVEEMIAVMEKDQE